MRRLMRPTLSWMVGLLASLLAACGGTSPTAPAQSPTGSQIGSISVTAPVGLFPGESGGAGAAIVIPGQPEPLTGMLTWSSSDTNIATVSSNGTVTGVAPGTARITASVQGVSGSALVTIYSESDLLGVAMQCPETLQVGQGAACVANATIRGPGIVPVNGRAMWSSSSPSVAVVSAGLLIAKSAGQTLLSMSFHGQSASANLSVQGGGADFIRVDAIPQQGVFRRGSTVTLWLVGFYSLVSSPSATLTMQVSDQNNTVAASGMTLTRGGDAFTLQTQFTIAADATRICPMAVMRVGSNVTAQDPADGLRYCIAISQ